MCAGGKGKIGTRFEPRNEGTELSISIEKMKNSWSGGKKSRKSQGPKIQYRQKRKFQLMNLVVVLEDYRRKDNPLRMQEV